MEQEEISALLEKYWLAETTLEEERKLTRYFAQLEPGAGLEPFKALFTWREEEAQVAPGEEFDRRLLEQAAAFGQGRTKARIGAWRPWVAYAVAAAVLLCIAIPFWVEMTGRRTRVPPAAVTVRGRSSERPIPAAAIRKAEIKDTYSDPRQALAAIRRALLIASAGINRGKHMTEKNMTRLHHSWQAAVGD